MTPDIIRDLYAYTDWANARVLDAVAGLPQEAFTRDLGSSFPSVHATLVHMLGAEWIWLKRWQGESPPGMPAHWPLVTAADVRERWNGVAAERRSFLASLDDARLRAILDYRNMRGDAFRAPLFEILLHAVNHATYHRGQIVTMLRQLGAPGVGTDLVVYHRERARSG